MGRPVRPDSPKGLLFRTRRRHSPPTRLTVMALFGLVALLSACGFSGPSSGGPLTVPSTEADSTTTSTTEPIEQTTPTTRAPDDGPPSTTSPSAASTTSTSTTVATTSVITVYFLDDAGRAIPARRTVNTPTVAAAALDTLIRGPSASEQAAGLSTAFPPDSLVLGVDVAAGLAHVDLSREFESGGGSSAVLGRLAQLVYTLTEFPTIDRVRLILDGDPVEYFSGEGVLVGKQLTRADFTGAVPIGPEHESSGVSTWEQEDLPGVDEGAADARRVVLVASDDFLNVRNTAGVSGEVIGRLLPGVAVRTTGSTRAVGESTWMEVATPAGPGWVNGFYLTPSLVGTDFPAGTDPLSVVEELADRLQAGDDFTDLVSQRGLWVAHHDDPIRFQRDGVSDLLDDPTTYRWGSNALEPGSPEIEPRTFSEAIAERFVDTYHDPDRDLHVNQLVEGPNGRPPEFALSAELTGFPWVTVFDPGDDPQYEGLDWMSWVVSLSYEEGDLRVVGLTIDQWAP